MALTVVMAVVLSATACRPDESSTALAVTDHRWVAPGRLEVGTECADDVSAELGQDHGGSGLVQITLTGAPRLGRCTPTVTVELPPETDRVVDGTTSMVIDLGPHPHR